MEKEKKQKQKNDQKRSIDKQQSAYMVDDALICVSVSSSGPRGEGMENNTKLSKRNATVKKIV